MTRDRAWLLTDSRYTEAAQGQVKTAEVVQFDVTRKLSDWVKEVLGAVPGPVGAEEDRLSHSGWTGWEETLGRSLTPAAEILHTLRAAKDQDEKESLIQAQQASPSGRWRTCLGWLRPGSRSGRWPRN